MQHADEPSLQGTSDRGARLGLQDIERVFDPPDEVSKLDRPTGLRRVRAVGIGPYAAIALGVQRAIENPAGVRGGLIPVPDGAGARSAYHRDASGSRFAVSRYLADGQHGR